MTTVEYKLSELKTDPDLLFSLLFNQPKGSWIISHDGELVVIRAARAYLPKTDQILAAAKQAFEAKKTAGYTREDAIRDFNDATSAIHSQAL